ncbi:phage tail protein, partial [Riemerella columbipharyngis]
MGEIIVTQARSNLNLNNRNPLRSVTKAEYTKTLLGEDSISLTVESKTVLDFHINDYIDLRNKRYTLNTAPKVKKEQGFYTYDLTFEGMQYRLRKKIYFNLDTQGYQTTGDFPLTSTIETFLQVLISNINQVDDFTWTLGEYPQNSETKTLTFSDENCLAVLQKICKEYDTEFEIAEDITHKRCVLNIKKFGETLPFTFEYGKGNGLYSLSRDNVNDEVITRLYVYGSTENLKADYRNFSERLKLPTSYGREYIEDGAKVKQYGLIEGIKTFDDIKPTFKGIVSAVGTLENGVQKLVVRNMDFDLNEKEKDKVTTKYLIAGTAAKLHFNKGNLAGYEFELSKYDHSTKTFSLKQFKDERGQAFPDAKATAFQFNVGDEFTLLDITMPDRYITNAENKLLQEGLKEYEKRSVNNLKYALDIDPMFLKDKGNTGTKFFSVGDYISIKDEALGVDKTSRIITLREDLLQEYKYNIDIADTYSISFVESIVSDIKDNQTVIKSIEKINKDNFRRGYANLKELKENIFDTDGYFDTEHIKPNSIEANMIAIGARSQQFALENITLNPNVRGNPANIHITAGNLVHFSIADNPKTWNLLEFYQTGLLNQVYYVYAKCEKTGNIGSWYVTTEKIKFDERPQHYYFLCYLLYTPVAGKRSAEAMYGNTILHGGQITTGRISSVNGQTYFDLDSGEISGKIRFTADSPAIEQVKDSVEDDLGTLAFEDSVEKSMLGNTIIQGGYIKTELINAA